MSARSFHLFSLSIGAMLVISLLTSAQGVTVVRAQSSTPESSCITCHENQYYLYDSGRWYCVSEAQERCVNCHAGNLNALNEQEAHTGLIAKPLSDGGEHCQSCHAQDTEMYIQKVIGQTGYHAQTKTVAYIPQIPAGNGLPTSLPVSSKSKTPFWFVPAAIAVFIFWARLVTQTSKG